MTSSDIPNQPTSTEDNLLSAKIVISGGFGAGKTTLVGAISEIPPIRTEAVMTSAGSGVDEGTVLTAKRTTTVALDFGRVTVEGGIRLYLFGTPGQKRYQFMWDDLVRGALGAVVVVDTRRLDDCYQAIDYYESRNMAFLIAINQFEGAPKHRIDQVRQALGLADDVPIVRFDARNRGAVAEALARLFDVLLSRQNPTD